MKPETEKIIREKWLPALRSGEYQQGEAALKHINYEGPPSYCCLGVLCEILGLEQGEQNAACDIEFIYSHNENVPSSHTRSAAILPLELAKELDITPYGQIWPAYEVEETLPYSTGRKPEYSSLVAMNDAGKSFEYIANFIEQKILDPESGFRFISPMENNL